MRLSNKSTFSLASLILLMAFVTIPVMAHETATDADHPTEDHLAHAIAESIKFSDDSIADADGYVRTDSFVIKIEFDGAGGAPTDFDDTNISAGGWTVREVSGSGRSYTARILPPSPGGDASCCHKFNGRRCGYG